MAHTSHLLPVILIIIFFIISSYTTLNLIPNSSSNAAIYLGLKITNKGNMINFRFLQEFSKFKLKNKPYLPHLSPSPAPAPGPGIAPEARPVSTHRNGPRHKHQNPPLPHAHKAQHRADQGKKALAAILASVGIVFVLLLCAIGLFFGHRKFCKKKTRQRRNVIRSEVASDLFYLDSLESALQPEKNCCLKVSSSSVIKCSNQSSGYDEIREVLTCSGEITAVGEVLGPNNGSNSLYGDRIIPVQGHKPLPSSDDESFHSFCESQIRLSNASCCSVEENLESITPNDEVNEVHCSPPLPPPPPPPPPPQLPMKVKSNVLSLQSLSESSEPMSSSTPPGPSRAAAPPLPPAPPREIPLGKDGSPLPKLKPLHWDKVRAAPNRTTVWDKLRSSSFEFDEEMIESLFGYNLQNSTKNDEAKSKTSSPNKHILDPKRLQNFIILSKALSVNEEQVCGALIQGDGLSLQDLEALSKMVPTQDEEAKLVNYKGDVFELSFAEKLVKEMLKIPFAFSRIESMLYRETFEDDVLHLRKSFSMLEEACKELRSSRLFLKLLEAVLKTGNRMNIGTIRGGAKAFKLDALLKLADVKGTDGKTTLLHFVVLEIIRSEGQRASESIMGKIHQKSTSSSMQDKEENYQTMGLDLVSGLSTELCNVKKTATIDLDVLASSVATLSKAMHKMKRLIEKEMIIEEKTGNFICSMRSFLKYAEMKLKELQEDENRVLLQVREITEYFHGDKGKDEPNPLRIFVIVRDFLSMLDHVCKELKSLKTSRNINPLVPFR